MHYSIIIKTLLTSRATQIQNQQVSISGVSPFSPPHPAAVSLLLIILTSQHLPTLPLFQRYLSGEQTIHFNVPFRLKIKRLFTIMNKFFNYFVAMIRTFFITRIVITFSIIIMTISILHVYNHVVQRRGELGREAIMSFHYNTQSKQIH